MALHQCHQQVAEKQSSRFGKCTPAFINHLSQCDGATWYAHMALLMYSYAGDVTTRTLVLMIGTSGA